MTLRRAAVSREPRGLESAAQRPPLAQRSALLRREVAKPLAQLHAALGRQHAVAAIHVEETRALGGRQAAEFLIALACGRALLIGHAAPDVEPIPSLRDVAAVHVEEALGAAGDLLLTLRLELRPPLLVPRQ